jgi:hypothetical protein
MDGVPAVWRVARGAAEEKLEDVLRRLAERLQIDTPEIRSDHVLLPAEYPRVAQALDEVEPGWRDESLLLPPEP